MDCFLAGVWNDAIIYLGAMILFDYSQIVENNVNNFKVKIMK